MKGSTPAGFLRYISVMQALAKCEKGATVGKVQEMTLLTRGEGERVLKSLVRDGMVIAEAVKYNKNINKRVYHLSEKAVEYCECIVIDYDNSKHQGRMFNG